MMSYVTSLFQRSPIVESSESPKEPLENATAEEAGDWLVISIATDVGKYNRVVYGTNHNNTLFPCNR